MKLLKRYFRSLKVIENDEKNLTKELKADAKDHSLLKSFLIFLPGYLIIINLLFMFISLFYVLIFTANILIFLNIYLYHYTYYKYINLPKHKLSFVKTIVYGAILSVILWVVANIVGGFLWKTKSFIYQFV